jgi:hypothetical protein
MLRSPSISILKHPASLKGGDFRGLNIYSVDGEQPMNWVPEQLKNSLSLFFTSSILVGA